MPVGASVGRLGDSSSVYSSLLWSGLSRRCTALLFEAVRLWQTPAHIAYSKSIEDNVIIGMYNMANAIRFLQFAYYVSKLMLVFLVLHYFGV